jgi:hypothetical protein
MTQVEWPSNEAETDNALSAGFGAMSKPDIGLANLAALECAD